MSVQDAASPIADHAVSRDELIGRLTIAAEDPRAYMRDWKERHDGRPVIGALPMNLPVELVIAAGGLPVIVQESREPITAGRNLLYEFHCGYTRSLADQAATGQFEGYDGFVIADQCIQLQGAVDVMQYQIPEIPVRFGQFIASMDEAWTRDQVGETIASLSADIEEITGTPVTPERVSEAIASLNENRLLLREIYALRREGQTDLTASQMQALVKSSMVMDRDEHTAALRQILPLIRNGADADVRQKVRLHLSGHFCHAPRIELLDLIEECGAVVVDDDLYTGYRYISTDVPEDGDPFEALGRWYMDRNVNVPCPTRAQRNVDWDRYLIDAVERAGAQGVIVLMAKFCEPHMLYYPELRQAMDDHAIPHLLIETEHEGLPTESIRTRVETLLERIRRPRSPAPA